MRFKMGLFNSNKILGLDIGYESLRLVELSNSGGKFKLVGYNEIPLRERILERDHFKNKAATASLIKEACKSAKPNPITAKKIVSALPESFVFSKTIQMPKMSEKELTEAIETQAVQYLPIPPEEVYIDHQVLIVHPDEPLIDILFVAAPKKLVDDYVDMSRMAGFELTALETKPLSVGRSVLTMHPTSNATAIIEIGTELSRVSIWEDKQIRLMTSINTGKNQIKEFIGDSMEINETNFELAKSVLSNISSETINAIKYHQNRDYKPKPIEKVLLCGSGANIKNIGKYLSLLVNIKTSVVSPDFEKEKIGPEFITAVGLAMRPEN